MGKHSEKPIDFKKDTFYPYTYLELFLMPECVRTCFKQVTKKEFNTIIKFLHPDARFDADYCKCIKSVKIIISIHY